MTKELRMLYVSYLAAAYTMAAMILVTAWRAGTTPRWSPDMIVWRSVRDLFGGPAFLLLITGTVVLIVAPSVRRGWLMWPVLAMLTLAFLRCFQG
jgi:hypothetical protein